MSDLAAYVGATYKGEMKEGRYHGQGVFTYPTGVRYEGAFDNNQFHGAGRLIFDSGAVYAAHWNHGVEVVGSGEYKFKDGLVGPSDTAPFDHLTPSDRRFWSEHLAKAVRPGETVARANESDSGIRKEG